MNSERSHVMDRIKWQIKSDCSRCPLQNGAKGVDWKVFHNHSSRWMFCERCLKENARKQANNEEVLFPRGLPPSLMSAEQLKIHENMAAAAQDCAVPANEQKKKAKEKNKADKKKEPESDKQIIQRLTHQGYTKEKALEVMVSKKREKAKAEEAAKGNVPEKAKVNRDEMPWMPRLPFFHIVSEVYPKAVDHLRYVAIASNFLDSDSQVRFVNNLKELAVMDKKLEKEREKYQLMVVRSLVNRKRHAFNTGVQSATRFVLGRANKRRMAVTGCYGSPLKPLDGEKWSVDVAAAGPRRKCVLHAGKFPRLAVPNEKRKFSFCKDVSTISNRFPLPDANKHSIEEDSLAMHLAVKNGIRVIMGASSAISIMTDPWLANCCNYVLPVTVKNYFSEEQGCSERVVIVGKPCVMSELNAPSVWYRFVKYAVKHALYPLSQNTAGRQHMKSREDKNNKKWKAEAYADVGNGPGGYSVRSSSEMDESGDESLVIAEEKSPSGPDRLDNEAKGAAEQNILLGAPSTSRRASLSNDIVGGILSAMSSTEGGFEGATSECKQSRETESELSKLEGGDLEKQYSIFSLGLDGIQDVLLLIRTKNDGRDAKRNVVAVVPKVEYAPEFGAERLHDEEWLHDVLKCKFKGASHLLRLRIHHSELHFLQKECLEENTTSLKRQNGHELLKNRTTRLKAAVLQLENLQHQGSYLLRVNSGGGVEILPQLPVDIAGKIEVDMNSDSMVRANAPLPSVKSAFQGIDEHLVLVYNMIYKKIPAAFRPENPRGKKEDNKHKRSGDDGADGRGRPKKKKKKTARADVKTHVDLDAPQEAV